MYDQRNKEELLLYENKLDALDAFITKLSCYSVKKVFLFEKVENQYKLMYLEN